MLRNTESEGTLVSQLLKVGWIHKGSRIEAYRRSSPFFILAVIHGLGFWGASTLSSMFIAQDNAIQWLSDVRNCGWMAEPNKLDFTNDRSFDVANALGVMTKYNFKRSAAYSRVCYMQSGGNSTTCGIYIQPTLPTTVSTDAACPFDEKICNGKAIAIDSGLIRSDHHLGINTRPEDSISARKVLTCAPLAAEKYTDGWIPVTDDMNLALLPQGTLVKGYKFGPRLPIKNSPLDPYTFGGNNFTFALSNLPYELE